MSVLIAVPPAIGAVQTLGLGARSKTQMVNLLPSGCQVTEIGARSCCAMKSAATSRGGVPSTRTTWNLLVIFMPAKEVWNKICELSGDQRGKYPNVAIS